MAFGTAGRGPRGGLSAFLGRVANRFGGGGGVDAFTEMSTALLNRSLSSSSGTPGAICLTERRLCARAMFGLALGGGGGGAGAVGFVRFVTLGDLGGGDGFFTGGSSCGGFGAKFGLRPADGGRVGSGPFEARESIEALSVESCW